jgi:CDP-paratose 2-epimerase
VIWIPGQNRLSDYGRANAHNRYEETNRIGDHMWWISDVRKFQRHYPAWKFRYSLREILEEIHHSINEHAK